MKKVMLNSLVKVENFPSIKLGVIYDVVKCIPNIHNVSVYDLIQIIDDKNIKRNYYLKNKQGVLNFIDVSLKYRNNVIDNILS